MKAGRNSPQYNIRFPEGLRDRLHEAAEANGRSFNSEVIARLEESLVARAPDAEISRIIEAYVAKKVEERLTEVARALGGKP